VIQCKWCKVKLSTSAERGWYSCECKAISVDIGHIGYYRVIGNFDDMIMEDTNG